MENMEIPERRSATIYIDGDAIPRELKEAVYRAAERTRDTGSAGRQFLSAHSGVGAGAA